MLAHITSILSSALIGLSMLTSSIAGITLPDQTFTAGAIQGAADFRTSLAATITDSATTMTLVSTSTTSGINLVQGNTYGFKLGGQEYVIGTLSSGKQITGMTRVLQV